MRHLLLTAGPTHEPIDAVRYIANRSSGKMGIALASAARDAGWGVTLLLGPVEAEPPTGVRVHRFVTTADLVALLETHFPVCDVLIMAAAVADYRPAQPHGSKLPRSQDGLTLELEATPDLVAACAARKTPGQKIIGFALEESANLSARAVEKLKGKQLDAIVANPLQTMSADSIDAQLFFPDGRRNAPGKLSKAAFAHWLISEIGLHYPHTSRASP